MEGERGKLRQSLEELQRLHSQVSNSHTFHVVLFILQGMPSIKETNMINKPGGFRPKWLDEEALLNQMLRI